MEYEVEKGRQQEKAIDEAIRCLCACKVDSGEMVCCMRCVQGMFPPEVHWNEGRCWCDVGEGVCVPLLCVSMLVAVSVLGDEDRSMRVEGGVELSQK